MLRNVEEAVDEKKIKNIGFLKGYVLGIISIEPGTNHPNKLEL